MKRYTESIDVRFEQGRPVQLIRTHPVAARRTRRYPHSVPSPRHTTCTILDILEAWKVRGRWWARESTRTYLRIRTDRGTFEVCREKTAVGGTRWMLTGIAD